MEKKKLTWNAINRKYKNQKRVKLKLYINIKIQINNRFIINSWMDLFAEWKKLLLN